MKKVISSVLIISIAVLLVFSLCACNSENKIVGTWKVSSFDMSYGDNTNAMRFDFDGSSITFHSDGTVTNSYNQSCVWSYDKKTKEYTLADSWEESDLKRAEKAYIDKDGILHIDIITYKKV